MVPELIDCVNTDCHMLESEPTVYVFVNDGKRLVTGGYAQFRMYPFGMLSINLD